MKTKISRVNFDEIIEGINQIEADTILIIADLNVWSAYSKTLDLENKIKDKRIIIWKAPDGEKTKNFTDYESCLEFFISKGIHRKSHLIAIGGGATSDFAGFVASTLLRGLSWSIIPTTLLSQVDAAIGGKVAINSSHGKNLVGSFHLPQNIWINSSFLKSLPEEEYKSGKGEILKYAFLDKKIFDLLNKDKVDVLVSIEACADFKVLVTEEDLEESGRRKTLNLGHSFGHAFEQIYNLCHGEAVMWGLGVIFKVYGNQCLVDQLSKLKTNFGLEHCEPPWLHKTFPVDDIMIYLKRDKKTITRDSIDLIIANSPGDVSVKTTLFSQIEEDLEKAKDELKSFTF